MMPLVHYKPVRCPRTSNQVFSEMSKVFYFTEVQNAVSQCIPSFQLPQILPCLAGASSARVLEVVFLHVIVQCWIFFKSRGNIGESLDTGLDRDGRALLASHDYSSQGTLGRFEHWKEHLCNAYNLLLFFLSLLFSSIFILCLHHGVDFQSLHT